MSASVSMPLGGVQVGSYENYQQAQRAVDFLSDEKFPVENVTIIGSDLRMVERVTGRLSWGRAIGAGAASGAWFGLFVGLLLGIFAPSGSSWVGSVLTGLLIGLVFGALFGAMGYAATRGRRDFTSTSAIVAGRYDVMCNPA
ncbi:MAG TPA: general stress protein, partial [Gaiellales bacterium]|nr:general stress protein [Gaiellales bacterium]